jgi:sarcosine oxidase subunit gamma
VAETIDSRNGDAGDVLAIGDVTFALAWNVRGDPGDEAFVSGTSRALGPTLPLAAMTGSRTDAATLLWLGPRSWLYVSDVTSTPDEFEPARRAVNAVGGALFDVSASYVGWHVSGALAARVLNRACPLDFHPRAFAPGQCAQSLLGHINALFYKPGEDQSFVVMVARSVASGALHVLREAARSDGYRLVEPRSFLLAE